MRAPNSGFTLVEVVVSLFLIGLGVLAAAPMFMFAMQGNAVGEEKGVAAALAVERLEMLRAVDYWTLALAPGGSLTVNTNGFFDNSDPDYTIRWLVTTNTTPDETIVISVRVVPAGTIPGSSRVVTLTTLRGPET